MPAWIHERAKHLLAKNPDMNKSTAFAVATQQGHKLGKNPKGYGTPEGKRTAKAKLDKPKKEYVKGANPGDLTTPKLKEAMMEELAFILFDRKEKRAGFNSQNSSLLPQVGKPKTKATPVAPPDPRFEVKQGAASSFAGTAMDPKKRLAQSQKVGVPQAPNTPGPVYKPLGAKLAFQTSQYSGPLSTLGSNRYSYRAPGSMPGFVNPPVKTAGPPPPGEEGQLPGDAQKEKVSLAAASALLRKLSSVATTPAGQLSKAQKVGQPKVSNPPGPSIQQVAKPVGYSNPRPGTTLGAL